MHPGNTPPAHTGGEAVLRFFEARTARHVFGLPGSSSIPIFHAFGWSTRQFVAAVQENAAIAMADGYARIKGPTGVLLYMVPGVATAMSNLYNAWRDETPLVIVASQQASYARWDQASVGEADLVQLAAPFTRYAREASHASQLSAMLDAACRAALGPPAGPALVVAPEDLLREATPAHAFAPRQREKLAPASLDLVTGKLAAAERPLIIVGGQLRRSAGSAAIEALADEFEIPLTYEPFWNDRLGVSPGHRCCFSNLTEGSSLGSQADFVLAIGCRMFNEIHPRPDAWFAADAFVAHVNADAQKLEQTFPVTWSCAADPGVVAERLLDESRRVGIPAALHAARAARLSAAMQRRAKARPGPYSDAAEALSGELDAAWLIDESVSGNYPLVTRLKGHRGERYLSTTGGSLGWGIGAACGVALATGEPVTCVTGDGAYFFGMHGLAHARALNLPVSFVVLDNGGFGSTQWFEQQFSSAHPDEARRATHFVGSDFRGSRPDVLDVARGFGIAAVEAADGQALRRHLEANRGKGPSVARLRIASMEKSGK